MKPRGSSPRGRGKLKLRVVSDADDGLIPAWAGKTLHLEANRVQVAAHPRVGGENYRLRVFTPAGLGSSPRGRGKPWTTTGWVCPCRLIPAWAGKTRTRAGCASANPAHPRVGGENAPSTTAGRREIGSSPRGRGKHTRRQVTLNDHGLIPAWAGKTSRALVDGASHRAHPRVGGENKSPPTPRCRA